MVDSEKKHRSGSRSGVIGFGNGNRNGNNAHSRASETFAAVVVAAAAGNGAASKNVSNAAAAACQQTVTAANNHQSRRNVWIKKRWKAAFHTIRAVGNWRKLDDLKNGQIETDSPATALATASIVNDDCFVVKKKWHAFVAHYPQQRPICAICETDSPNEYSERKGAERCAEEDEDDYIKCQYCPMVVHRCCVNSVTGFCQAQKPRFLLRKQKSTTPSEEFNQQQQQQQQRRPSITAVLDPDDDEYLNAVTAQSPYQNQGQPTVVVDPIYLALKEANRMASTRRVSVTSSPSPVGLNACSPRDLTPTDSMRELTVNRLAWCKLPSSASGTSYGSSSGYGSNAVNVGSSSNVNTSTKSLRNSPARMQSVSSTPSLIAQKSTESQEGSVDFRRPIVAAPPAAASTSSSSSSKPTTTGQRRPPKLDSKMKSLSLDCPDAKVRSKGTAASGYSPVGRRVLKVRPCKNSSFDASDDGADPSSTSCSPCPSPYCGSTLTLPSCSYAVTHDHHAKFPEEIDLGVGERVFVFETGDPDWWQGQNVCGRIGIFPSTCVAHIHNNERVMQVVQNLNLWDGSKSLRLYRDQIVFAQQAEPDGLVEIRTEHDHRINCPIQYLMCLD